MGVEVKGRVNCKLFWAVIVYGCIGILKIGDKLGYSFARVETWAGIFALNLGVKVRWGNKPQVPLGSNCIGLHRHTKNC